MTSPNGLSASALTDQQLVELALRREDAACRELVHRYGPKVFAIVVGILRDRDDAESAWQRTFIRVFQSLARFQPDRSFGNWVARIARNTALDKAREYRDNLLSLDRSSDPDDPFQPLELLDPGPNPLEEVTNITLCERAVFAMTSLESPYREALLLKASGFQNTEIAARMGAPVNTVNSWIVRGRERLAQAVPAIVSPFDE